MVLDTLLCCSAPSGGLGSDSRLPFIEDVLDEYLESISSACVLDLLDEYQSLLLEFLYADLGIVFCLMVLWGAQILSSWWP